MWETSCGLDDAGYLLKFRRPPSATIFIVQRETDSPLRGTRKYPQQLLVRILGDELCNKGLTGTERDAVALWIPPQRQLS